MLSEIGGVSVRGLVAALPSQRETAEQMAERFGVDVAQRIEKAIGIHERRVVVPGQGFTQLAEAASKRLIAQLGWEPESVDVLVAVTQTADHVLPAAACVLQNALGLPRSSAAFVLNLGCSGYIYGLWNVASLFATSRIQRAILVTGDVTSTLIQPDDRSVRPLFGDAVVATALERDASAEPMYFALGTDGAGAPYLTAPRGGSLSMDGTQVFAFTLREVPKNIQAALDLAGWEVGAVDRIVLHQANAMMIRHLGAKIAATPEQLVVALAQVGNTSSASIPLALAMSEEALLRRGGASLLLSGFGVGWSWGTAALKWGPLAHVETIEVGI